MTARYFLSLFRPVVTWLWFGLVTPNVVRAESASGMILAQVTVTASEIRLTDIARLSGASPSLMTEFSSVTLGPSPRAGKSFVWPKGTVQARIRSSFAGNSEASWLIPERITITRQAQRIESHDLQQALQAHIATTTGVKLELIRLDEFRSQTSVFVPVGALRFEVMSADFGSDETTTWTLKILVNDQAEEKIRVSASFSYPVSVYKTTRNVRRGSIVMAADLRSDTIEFRGGRNVFVKTASDFVGRTWNRALKVGEPIRYEDLSMPLAVIRGEPVRIVVHTATLSVSCVGTALDDAALGQLVSAVNDSSGKTVRGRVVGDGRVLVDFDAMSEFSLFHADQPPWPIPAEGLIGGAEK